MKKQLLSLSFAAVLVVATAGCGASQSTAGETTTETNGESASVQTETQEPAAGAYPLTIEHAFGETVIAKKPERVATIAFGNQDVVLALGIVPVGFSAANYGVEDESGMLPWTKEKLAELGCTEPNVFQDTDGIDYEAVTDCSPDIIICPYSGISQEEYDLLSEIAPVVAYPDQAWTISTEDWITTAAKALGVEEKGAEVIQGMQDKISEIKTDHPEFAGKSFVWVSFNQTDLSKLHAYSPEDARCKFLGELGFSYPESVSQYVVDGQYSLDISAENADLLYDADFVIGYSAAEDYEAAKADAVLGEIPALQNNAIVSIENGTPLSAALTITPLSFDYSIDEYVSKIAEATANAK